MKKIVSLILGVLCVFGANAAQIANIEYVHKMIEHKWDITVPYNPALTDVKTIANMKYLLTAVDVANEILNGEKTTDYGNGEFATTQIADTVATNQAVETLVRKEIEYKFYLTFNRVLSPQFGICISAAGEFVIDWGDGTVETITKTNTTYTTYLHDYSTTGEYTIGIGGQATAYNVEKPAITFPYEFKYDIFAIDGSLGAIFSTLPDGSQPLFNGTFSSTSFYHIPENLFSGISGAPAKNMFDSTFATSFIKEIPAGLFAGISGPPAEYMFFATFLECFDLTSIPENLFGNISGTAQRYMFSATFDSCTSLTGPSARINGKYLYEIWPDATSSQVSGMYYGARGLSDYSSIPSPWK